ncbi:MAG TPA: hypothetical protein PKY71_10280, partial [Smithellaceae bacterium]|nr:hypothetical protein [Smithellaceae bacterium]
MVVDEGDYSETPMSAWRFACRIDAGNSAENQTFGYCIATQTAGTMDAACDFTSGIKATYRLIVFDTDYLCPGIDT